MLSAGLDMITCPFIREAFPPLQTRLSWLLPQLSHYPQRVAASIKGVSNFSHYSFTIHSPNQALIARINCTIRHIGGLGLESPVHFFSNRRRKLANCLLMPCVECELNDTAS